LRTSRNKKGYSPEVKRECLALLAAGMTPTAVHKKKGISTMTLWRWRKSVDGSTGNGLAKSDTSVTASPEKGRRGADLTDAAQEKSRAPHDNVAGLSDKEVEEILKLKREHHGMGPAQLRAQLKRFKGWRIAVKAIARVLKVNGYQVEHRSAREEQELQRFEAPRPNALWMMDALQLRVHELRLYLHLVIDDFSRFIVGHRLSEDITSAEAVATLKEAFEKHGKPERILTDRGGQFLAVRGETAFRRFLEAELIDHSVSRAYHPQTLGKVESVNRAIQKELIYLKEFASAEEARAAIGTWVDQFNFQRAHLGIDGLTPADRYFGLHQRVLSEVQARSRLRQTAAALDSPIGGPIDDLGGALEVLRLVLVNDRLELRFCGARAELGKA
jgi:transposase InsO family protein